MDKKYSAQQRDFILKKIEELKPWYHRIDFGDGIITPGLNLEKVWEGANVVVDKFDYKGKKVLDLASWDGYWAFKAESKGASLVVSSDIRLEGYRNLLFAREILKSDVIPLCNVSVQDLENRLDGVGLPEKYDVIHHFGLLYHLRDPLLSFAQVRKMLNDDGVLILETAFIDDDKNSYMMFSGLPDNIHFYGMSDAWAPTKLCLREMLIRSFLKPIREDEWQIVPHTGTALGSFLRSTVKGKAKIGRITMMARPMPQNEGRIADQRKVFGPQ